jgi:hypothetical protein
LKKNMLNEIKSKVKELRGASDTLSYSVGVNKWSIRLKLAIYFVTVYFITSTLFYPIGAFGYFLSGVLCMFIPGLIAAMRTEEKQNKEFEKHIENAKFLESYYKGELMEHGYDWRKVDE